MGCRYECKKYGKQRFKCCIECEHYKYCNNRNSVCDRIHFHEYMEECPDYVKEDEDEQNRNRSKCHTARCKMYEL